MALLELLLRRTGMGAGLGLAIGLSYYAASLPIILESQRTLLDAVRAMIAPPLTEIMLLAIFLTLALRVAPSGLRRLLALGAAIVVTVVFHSSVMSLAGQHGVFGLSFGEEEGATLIYTQWLVVVVGILVAVYYGQWERAQASARRLLGAQLSRQKTECSVLESRLNVVRARVEPEFLFEVLSGVRDRYAARPGDAESLLDELITYLRATLPQSRERASTLGQEIDLATAYLRVISLTRGRHHALENAIEDPLAGGFFPPMVLMPLVEDAVRRARLGPADEPRISVRGRAEGGRAMLVIEDNGRLPEPSRPEVHELRATLRAFFGPDARVESREDPAGSMINIEFGHADAPVRRDGP